MSKITYANKVAINENAEISDINKVTDSDMNEIKTVVNNNDDDMITINAKLTDANTYSTTETVVGTWVNNKPIYRKVVARNITAKNGTNISLSSLNVDELLKVKSINKKVSNNFTFYDNFFDSSNEKITLHYKNDIIEFWAADGTNYTSTVWIEYTKTTD